MGKESEIAKCSGQGFDDYLEWQFVVDDRNGIYDIYAFELGEYAVDIERARYVPFIDKYHTDCYAQIAFESGITQSEQEIVIQKTVDWVVGHFWALIGFIVGVVLLFCMLLTVIVVLWRKHVEMKEFILADTEDPDECDTDNECAGNQIFNVLDTKRPSTIDLDISTPGGLGYMARSHSMNSNQSQSKHKKHSLQIPYITPTSSQYTGQTQFEYNLGQIGPLNVDKIAENAVTANIDHIESDTDSSDDEEHNHTQNLLNVQQKKKNKKRDKTPQRRSSILGISYDQIKLLQHKDNKKKMDKDAEKLLEDEWDRESNGSLGL